jgi:hypothetical protein
VAIIGHNYGDGWAGLVAGLNLAAVTFSQGAEVLRYCMVTSLLSFEATI